MLNSWQNKVLFVQVKKSIVADLLKVELAMDSIKKKMEKLASETAEAEARIAHFEELKVLYLHTIRGIFPTFTI